MSLRPRTIAWAATAWFCLGLAACGGGGSGGDGSLPKPPAGASANLSALAFEQVTLVPAFSSATLNYAADVANTIDSTRATPTAADPAATIRVNGVVVASGTQGPAIALAEGDNEVTVAVTAADGATTRTYRVTITRRPPPSTDARLADAELSAAPLDQIFASNLTSYTAAAGFLATSTRVTATPVDAGATLTLNGSALENATPSALQLLAVGDNPLTIEVTAEDGTTKRTYSIVLTRGALAAVGQEVYVKASNTDPDDRFGSGIALARDRLLIAAPGEASGATGIDGTEDDDTQSDAGAAYLYTRAGGVWTQAAYLKASNTDSGDRFGSAVAIAADGLGFAVAADGEASAATGVDGDQASNSAAGAGAAYVFSADPLGDVAQIHYVKAANTDAGDRFGTALALAGTRLLVGAPGEDSRATGVNGTAGDNSQGGAGAAYLFGPDALGTWRQLAYLKASNTEALDAFGISVALDGTTAAVGAWGEDSNATGVGGNATDNSAGSAGAVYLFDSSNGFAWVPRAYIKASNTEASDGFGGAVALAGDLLAVGAAGEASAATSNGNQADNSAPGAGAVYVFHRGGNGAWTQEAYLKAAHPSAGDGFGSSVRLDGNLLAVGAPGHDSAAVGINGDDQDTSALDAGGAYLFRRDASGGWVQLAYVKASNADPGDAFARALDVDRDTFVAGAPFERGADTGSNGDESSNASSNAGAGYVIR